MFNFMNMARGGDKKASKRHFYSFKSFTLAEVLITLTIIGIVASMTIPLVTANHKKIEYSAKLKKTYNMLNAAFEQAETDYNLPMYKWPAVSGSGNQGKAETFFNTYMKDYIKYTKTVKGVSYDVSGACDWGNAFSIYLDDGTIIALSGSSGTDWVLIDVNGEKGPNADGRDIFDFDLNYGDGSSSDVKPVNNYTTTDRDTLKTWCGKNNGYGNAHTCTALMVLDGWEFKDDYPLKL